MKRTQTMAVLGVLALVGCENMGLEYAGTGEEGRTRAPTDLVAAVHADPGTPAAQPIVLDGRRWVATGRPAARDESELRPIGSAGGQTLYARQWDDTPYNQLFAPAEGGMQAYSPVVGGDAIGDDAIGGHAPTDHTDDHTTEAGDTTGTAGAETATETATETAADAGR